MAYISPKAGEKLACIKTALLRLPGGDDSLARTQRESGGRRRWQLVFLTWRFKRVGGLWSASALGEEKKKKIKKKKKKKNHASLLI